MISLKTVRGFQEVLLFVDIYAKKLLGKMQSIGSC